MIEEEKPGERWLALLYLDSDLRWYGAMTPSRLSDIPI